MNRKIERYLKNRTFFGRWPLNGNATNPTKNIIVIPCLDEYPGILSTLNDIALADEAESSLVIVVVNNHKNVSNDDIEGNVQTLKDLYKWNHKKLNICWVDASSTGNELPSHEGVGLARKIGLDWGLRLLAEWNKLEIPLINLDADTRIEKNYLKAINSFFKIGNRWAATIACAHLIEGTKQRRAATLCYEFSLRYYADYLAWANSPYGYHSIGSAMTCTGYAYAAISGMNRRLAGEDFYFLQQLTKTGKVERIPGTTVHPSNRISQRTPFGTGQRIERFLTNQRDEYELYAPEIFGVIKDWISAISANPGLDSTNFLKIADQIEPKLKDFLIEIDFEKNWDTFRNQNKKESDVIKQFHRWFDGLRTLRLINYLRDNVWANKYMFEAIETFIHQNDLSPVVNISGKIKEDLHSQELLLQQLRNIYENRSQSSIGT